jgi:hypothetical protein
LYKEAMTGTVEIRVNRVQHGVRSYAMIKLTWLPNWKAYSVWVNGQILGLVRCKLPLPFRAPVEFV